ncbi:hypothetical protein LM602_03905 [Candidatus Acetothermia bacterium]|jgi:hypothetical protein|nr:hypothetical protein [Candidatus Acetothermia bacterium]MCI2431686.1 hypothetical protein [Candidatus Acetothermia bacterium]MCI2436402.1 hypothetical protein [Candidatus Acetothermia bacterium]
MMNSAVVSKQAAKARRLYRRLESRLLPEHRGQVVAIEIESGAYVVGDDELEVARQAQAQFPDKLFYFFRIGERAVHKLR